MKRVGIITMHAVKNYGSFMQAYATQKSIEKIGCEAEIIDYKYPNSIHGTKRTLKGLFLHLVNSFCKRFLPGNPARKLKIRWESVYSDYYHLSPYYANRDSLLLSPPDYDVYLIGSDQVWNEKFIKGDDVFFASFAPSGKKKVAFSSSFGCLSVSDKLFYRDKLLSLDSIAIREESGVRLARELCGRDDIYKVIDPSFLLTADEWRCLENKPVSNGKKYIFCYGSNNSDYMIKIAHKIAKEQGLEVYKCNGNFIDYFSKDTHYILDAGPKEWLGYIDNAELVIACSFHGIAFAIQFNTPFIGVYTGNSEFDSRLDNLLKMVHLDKCKCVSGDYNLPDLSTYINVDWNEVNSIIEINRKESISVLKELLK